VEEGQEGQEEEGEKGEEEEEQLLGPADKTKGRSEQQLVANIKEQWADTASTASKVCH
jgi:hypothetical protein